MKKNKKLFAILTLIAFMMTLVPALAFAAGTPGATFTAGAPTLTDDGNVEIAVTSGTDGNVIGMFSVNASSQLAAVTGVSDATVSSNTATITINATNVAAGDYVLVSGTSGNAYTAGETAPVAGAVNRKDITISQAMKNASAALAETNSKDKAVAYKNLSAAEQSLFNGALSVGDLAAFNATLEVNYASAVKDLYDAALTSGSYSDAKAFTDAYAKVNSTEFNKLIEDEDQIIIDALNNAGISAKADVAKASAIYKLFNAMLANPTDNGSGTGTVGTFNTDYDAATSNVKLQFDSLVGSEGAALARNINEAFAAADYASGLALVQDYVGESPSRPGTTTGAADVTTSSFGAQYVQGGNPNVGNSFTMFALFLDSGRNDVNNANQTLYIWAEDTTNPGTPSTAFVVDSIADASATISTTGNFDGNSYRSLANATGVYTVTNVSNDERIVGHFTRSGEYNIYAAFVAGSGDTEKAAVNNTTKMQLGNSKIVVNDTTTDPKTHYTATYAGNVLKDGEVYEFIQIAANNVANNNIVVTFKNDDNRLVGKTVTIDTNSANITASKTSAVTNSMGQIDFDLSGSREGTYYVYLSCDGFEVRLQVKVGNTSATYINLSSQPDAPIALYGGKDDLDIRVDLTDVNGNVVTGTNPGGATAAYTSSSNSANYKYVAFTAKPTGTVLKDADLAIVWDSEDENYYVNMNGKTFDKEGSYEIKIVLDNGNFVSVPFEVKQFTTPVQLLLDYDQTSIELGGSSNVPTVKYVDANGTKQSAKNKATLAGTGYAISNFGSDGKITVKNDEKYIGQTITVTAVDSRYNLTATETLTVADEAQSITFATTRAQVNVNNKINFSIIDSLGNVVSLGNDSDIKGVNFVVTNVPEGAKVSAVTSGNYQSDLKSTGTATMALTSDKEGDVTVQVLVSVEAVSENSTTGLVNKYYTGTETFKVTKEIGKGSAVVMTIGSATMVVNDTTVAIDAPAMIKDNRTFVPVRALMEAFGATVDFDATTNVVTIKADGKTITLTLGSSVLTVGDQAVTMDVAAFATNEGRTMVPVRAIAEAAGYTVEATYNADGSTASVVFTK